MEEDGYSPDEWSYNVIIRGFLQHKDASMAVQLIGEMRDKGFFADTKALVMDLLSNDGNLENSSKHLLFFHVFHYCSGKSVYMPGLVLSILSQKLLPVTDLAAGIYAFPCFIFILVALLQAFYSLIPWSSSSYNHSSTIPLHFSSITSRDGGFDFFYNILSLLPQTLLTIN